MRANQLVAATTIALFSTVAAFGQTTTVQPTDSVKATTKVQSSEKMQTLFSGSKKNIKYLGFSVGSAIQYSSLAGASTPIVGTSWMLHINKKWGIGAAGYATVDRNFAPKAINAAQKLNLNVMYGGMMLEYTPKPNAIVHVSFPLLIGGGMANVDSLGNGRGRDDVWGRGKNKNDRNEFDRYMNNNRTNNGVGFVIIQPGVNIEANVFRFAKAFVGASYRIVPSVIKPTVATTSVATLPTATATQLGGLNVTAGLRVGLFDYQLHQAKRVRAKKERSNQGSRRGFLRRK